MSKPQYKGTLIIIAGYPDKLGQMLLKNVIRLATYFDFPYWNGSDCTKFIASMAKKYNFQLTPEVLRLLTPSFDQLANCPG
jgi:hypothetical protein